MADDPQETSTPQSKSERNVTIHYIKSPQCIEMPVDGAYGGINPTTGSAWMSVFSERTPIPREVVVTKMGDEFKETRVDTRHGLIRTVNAILHFDINTAVALHTWLGDKIQTFRDKNPELFKDVKL